MELSKQVCSGKKTTSVSMNSARTDASLNHYHFDIILRFVILTHKITITLGNDNINYYNSSVSSLRVNSVVELVEMVNFYMGKMEQ